MADNSKANSNALRVKYLADVEKATNGTELCATTKQYCVDDKAQGAFAFNRMKKVLGHFGLISDAMNAKSYGLLGKQRTSFYEAFDQNISSDIMERLKDAAVYDSRTKHSHRSQDMFPSRDGKPREIPMINKKKSSKKRKKEAMAREEEAKLLALKSGSSSSTDESALAGSAQEIEEKVRSIKAQRLADAMSHASYAKLEQEQKDLIKHEWISNLLGLEEN